MLIEALGNATQMMDLVTQRHLVLANNIANAKSLGFVASKVSFEAQMDAAAGDLVQRGTAAEAMTLRIEPDLDAQGEARPVQLDEQMASLAENTLLFNFLSRAVSRQLSVMSLAVNDGKR